MGSYSFSLSVSDLHLISDVFRCVLADLEDYAASVDSDPFCNPLFLHIVSVKSDIDDFLYKDS